MNKNKRNRNKKKGAAAAQKAVDSDGSWEDELKKPLANEETAATEKNDATAEVIEEVKKSKVTKVTAVKDDWEDDDDTT